MPDRGVPRRAVFPGSFDPFSIAHLAIAEAAHTQLEVDTIVCSLTVSPLGKDATAQSPVSERADAIRTFRDERPWLDVAVTESRLLADVAVGFDWLVVGADKWLQLHDPVFYDDDPDLMAHALECLPAIAYVPRAGSYVDPPEGVTLLGVDTRFRDVSATAIRAGREDWRA